MTGGPTFDDVFEVMSAASVGDAVARVALPSVVDPEDPATRLAVALNLLLDDLDLRTLELRRTEDQLRQAQKLEAMGRLAGGVAHDFNNVLNAIGGYAQLLEEDLDEQDPRHDYAATIVESAQRAAGLTRQLLAFSRSQPLQPRMVDVGDVLRAIEPMLRRLVREDVALDWRIAPERWPVLVDRGQLEQVILNLVVNARDAMPEGGRLTVEAANVELDAEYARAHLEVTPGPHLLLAVSDTGEGMDAATQARIFEPFFTTKETGQGTGLGLATVYGVVRQSGGHIWVYSEPGHGSTFKVYFPRAADEPPASEPERVTTARSGGRERILVAEDDAAVRSLAREVLVRLGYEVLVASDGVEAVVLGRRQAVELLVSDVIMPGMNGPDVATELRRTSPDLRVLFLSGYTAGALSNGSRYRVTDDLLEKPFTPETLAAAVRAALDAPAGSEGAG